MHTTQLVESGHLPNDSRYKIIRVSGEGRNGAYHVGYDLYVDGEFHAFASDKHVLQKEEILKGRKTF